MFVLRQEGAQDVAAPITRESDIFQDDRTRFDLHDPPGGKIAKGIFDIRRITHAAGTGKPETGEHPVALLHNYYVISPKKRTPLLYADTAEKVRQDPGGSPSSLVTIFSYL